MLSEHCQVPRYNDLAILGVLLPATVGPLWVASERFLYSERATWNAAGLWEGLDKTQVSLSWRKTSGKKRTANVIGVAASISGDLAPVLW